MHWLDRGHDWRQRRHGCCIQHVGAHWPGDILDLLLAQIFEPEIKLVAHLIPHDPTDTNPARLGQRLQARGHVDTVAENVALVDDDVPNVDADAEPDPPFVGHLRLTVYHPALDLRGAAHRVDDALELS